MYSLIIVPIIVSLITQVIKLIIDGIPNNLTWQHLMADYGGMPSGHTAFVVSLCLMAGLNLGFDSGYFALAVAILVIVIRDAVGFRREIGKNAVLTNTLAKEVFPENPEVLLRERIGHTGKEILGGAIVGGLLTIALYWLMMLM